MKNLLVALVSFVLALFLAEALGRVFYEPRPQEMSDFKLTQSGFYQKDEELGWVPRKGIQGRHDRPGSFLSTFSTNSAGLRDGEHALEKPPGVRRIVVLGDSFAWGYGVNDGEIFTDYLEAMSELTEVINLGVTAYGLRQEIGILKRIGLAFEPDIVLQALTLNDIYREPAHAQQSTELADIKPAVKSDEDTVFRKFKQALARNSALYKMFQDATNRHKVLVEALVALGLKEPPSGFETLDTNIMPALRHYPHELEDAWTVAEQELLELRGISEAHGARFIVAVIPSLQSVNPEALSLTLAYNSHYEDDFDLDKPYRKLEAFARASGFEMINPVAAFRKQAGKGVQLYLPGDMHFNAQGHELFARQIFQHMPVLNDYLEGRR